MSDHVRHCDCGKCDCGFNRNASHTENRFVCLCEGCENRPFNAPTVAPKALDEKLEKRVINPIGNEHE